MQQVRHSLHMSEFLRGLNLPAAKLHFNFCKWHVKPQLFESRSGQGETDWPQSLMRVILPHRMTPLHENSDLTLFLSSVPSPAAPHATKGTCVPGVHFECQALTSTLLIRPT